MGLCSGAFIIEGGLPVTLEGGLIFGSAHNYQNFTLSIAATYLCDFWQIAKISCRRTLWPQALKSIIFAKWKNVTVISGSFRLFLSNYRKKNNQMVQPSRSCKCAVYYTSCRYITNIWTYISRYISHIYNTSLSLMCYFRGTFLNGTISFSRSSTHLWTIFYRLKLYLHIQGYRN